MVLYSLRMNCCLTVETQGFKPPNFITSLATEVEHYNTHAG